MEASGARECERTPTPGILHGYQNKGITAEAKRIVIKGKDLGRGESFEMECATHPMILRAEYKVKYYLGLVNSNGVAASTRNRRTFALAIRHSSVSLGNSLDMLPFGITMRSIFLLRIYGLFEVV